MAIQYVQSVYSISKKLPDRERFNLSNQIERAATSIVLNIAEGSTDQTTHHKKPWFNPQFQSIFRFAILFLSAFSFEL
jgi:four helix bundle protein